MNTSMLTTVKGIIAVHLNRKLGDDALQFNSDIEDVLKSVKIPTNVMGTSGEAEEAIALRDTLDWIYRLDKDRKITDKDLLTRVRLNAGIESYYTEVIRMALEDEGGEEDPELIRERVNINIKEIRDELRRDNLISAVRDANRRLAKSDQYFDQSEFLEELIEKLSEVKSQAGGAAGMSKSRLSTDDIDSIMEVFEKSVETLSSDGVLKTGYIGLNRMCGLGIPRGYYVNFGALTHNYKTGILLDLFRQIPIYNKPYMIDETKKPLILRVSFENQLIQDLPKLYRDIVEVELGHRVDLSKINVREAAQLIKDRMSVNGYTVAMEFFSPNDFTVDDLIAVVQDYESQGYEIHLLDVDYMELICKAKGSQTRADQAITDGAERLRGYTFGRGITVVTAHQLSTEAQALAREGTANFAERVSTGGWYMNCKSLHTKLDLEVLMHIHKTKDKSYLTFARGKMRQGEDVPMKYRSFAYEFHEIGGLHDDYPTDTCQAIYDLSRVTGVGGLQDDADW